MKSIICKENTSIPSVLSNVENMFNKTKDELAQHFSESLPTIPAQIQMCLDNMEDKLSNIKKAADEAAVTTIAAEAAKEEH